MSLLDLQLVRDYLTNEQIDRATSLAESKGCMLIRVGSGFSYEAEYFMLSLEQFSFDTGLHLLDCEKEAIMKVLANRVKNQIRFK